MDGEGRIVKSTDEGEKLAEAVGKGKRPGESVNNGEPLAEYLDAPEYCPAYVHDTLYEIMKKYTQCCRHDGRLQLKENIQMIGDDVLFDGSFSRVPPENSGNEIEWQHLQFRVSRVSVNSCNFNLGMAANLRYSEEHDLATCRKAFKLDSPANGLYHGHPQSLPNKSHYDYAIENTGQFCELLRQRIGPAKIQLKVSGGRLWRFRDLGC